MKAWIQKLIGDFKFDKDVYFNDKQYFVKKDNANKMFPFENRDTKNFPGIEYISKEIEIKDLNLEKNIHGRIIFTYHNDLNKWSSILYFNDKDLNKISTLNSIKFA